MSSIAGGVDEAFEGDFDSDDSGESQVFDRAFSEALVERCLLFLEELAQIKLYSYQREIAFTLLLSLIVGDGEEITVLVSRQAGKTEALACAIATAMILLPRLARLFPTNSVLAKYGTANGFMVGIFAPTEDQARDLLFNRIVDILESPHARKILQDPDIDDVVGSAGSKTRKLMRCGSYVKWQTCNPRAKIEGASFHCVVIDESQDADDAALTKSIYPMLAHYNGTRVLIGTPTTEKGEFYRAIQRNKRRQSRRHKVHYEYNWRRCAAENRNYAAYVKHEMERLGADADEFQMAYEVKWLLDRGMLVTDEDMEIMGDETMETVRAWTRSPVLVGIDPARRIDSTVVTVLYVDWENPDEFGMYDCRVLNWLELHGDNWETQYYRICEFLSNYWVMAIGVDAQGGGGAVAERLEILLPNINVRALRSNPIDQTARWSLLIQYLQKRKLGWPAHSRAKRLATYRRFTQQMVDVEKQYKNAYINVENPDKKGHDDYVDSLALALFLLKETETSAPEVEVFDNPFYEPYRARR